MEIYFRVHRYDPEVDITPRYQVYSLEVDEGMSILDGLHRIKWYQDGSLTFRRSCGSASCGSCGMLINGRNRLACNTRIVDLNSSEVSISPLPGFPVLRDLVVDWDPFFARDAAMMPYLINDTAPPEQERLQTPEEYEAIENSTRCIQCGCCSSACPIQWSNGEYYGPAALTRAYRFIADNRDTATRERLALVASESGIWRCHTIFNCTTDCPTGVLNTENIQRLKRKVMLGRLGVDRIVLGSNGSNGAEERHQMEGDAAVDQRH